MVHYMTQCIRCMLPSPADLTMGVCWSPKSAFWLFLKASRFSVETNGGTNTSIGSVQIPWLASPQKGEFWSRGLARRITEENVPVEAAIPSKPPTSSPR